MYPGIFRQDNHTINCFYISTYLEPIAIKDKSHQEADTANCCGQNEEPSQWSSSGHPGNSNHT